MLFLCESASPPASGQTPVSLAAANVRPGVCGAEVTPCHDKARRARQFKHNDGKLFTLAALECKTKLTTAWE